ARLAEGEGDEKRAVRHYRRALLVDPSKAVLILPALVRLFAKAGRPGDLDEVIRQTVQERPDAVTPIAVAALRDPSISGPSVDECIERYLQSESGLPGLDELQRQIEDLRRVDAPLTVRRLARVLLQQMHGEGYRYRCGEWGYH